MTREASGKTHLPNPHDPPASSPLGEMPTLRKNPQKWLPGSFGSFASTSPASPVVAEVLDRDPWHRSGKASQGIFYGVALSGIGAWVSLDVGSKLLNVAGCGIGLEGVTFTAKGEADADWLAPRRASSEF